MNDSKDARGPLPAAALAAVLAAVAKLITDEIALLKAEAARAVADARRALVLMAIAAVLALVALNMLAGAAVQGLIAAGLHPGWSMLAVGVGLLALALGYVQAARWRLRRQNLAPWRSERSLRRNMAALGGGNGEGRDNVDH